jgi:hypothetical protein
MSVYFGAFAATMTTAPDFFWGKDSVMMMPYFRQALGGADQPAGFFCRLTGLTFGILVLGYKAFGMSEDTFTKMTIAWHVLCTPFMFQASGNSSATTPWVWQLQMAGQLGLAAWGYSTLKGGKKK